jgi:hypothetical protein
MLMLVTVLINVVQALLTNIIVSLVTSVLF